MALTLTEALIRNRVNLTHENLEDIKALSLPGTFHEKIASLGTSLRKFTRLKSLDFSRNALESLQGLEHLELLEKLNLYYNNVATLEELKRLKLNQNLKDLDLRLNPVTRNEPDYRLFLIHMLPNLQKLDDRGVRDRERQAALIHFSTSQASEMVAVPKVPKSPPKSPHPRTEMMSKLMKGPSVLMDDDVAIIDMMNRNEGDFGAPRPLTGSAAKQDTAEDYSLDNLKVLDAPKPVKHREKTFEEAEVKTQAVKRSAQLPKPPLLKKAEEMYPHIMAVPSENVKRIGDGQRQDPNLLFHDQEEASTKYRGQGYFTPNPGAVAADSESYFSTTGFRDQKRDYEDPSPPKPGNRPRHQRSSSVPNRQPGDSFGNYEELDLVQRRTLNSVLNLVDRYWNGSQSLHKHAKFQEQAGKLLSELTHPGSSGADQEVRLLQQTLAKVREENQALRMDKGRNTDSNTLSEEELKASLRRAKDNMARMHEEIRHYVSENHALQKRLENLESNVTVSRQQGGAAASESLFSNQSMLDDLQRQNEALSKEIDLMRTKLKQQHHIQELASLLQESHKSLVETNQHLLQELQETKLKHQREVEQLHWSYDQLKSTMACSPSLHSNSVHSRANYSDSLEKRDT